MQHEKDETNGPSEVAYSNTALDRGSSEPVMVDDHDNEAAGDLQGRHVIPRLDSDAHSREVADADEERGPDREALYDSGWTMCAGLRVRVRWYGVGDHGGRRRWVRNLLSRPTA